MTATAPASVRSAAWIGLLIVGVAGTILAAVMPTGDVVASGVVVAAQAASVVAVAWRLRSTPPRPVLPWAVFVAGVGLSLVADLAGIVLGEAARWASNRPILDVTYVVSYAMLALGVALAARSRGAGHDPGEIVDALIVMATAGVAVFAIVLGVHVSAAPGTAAGAAALTVVVLDVLMIGLGSLVFIRLGRLTVAVGLLAGALSANLLSDAVYAGGVLGQMPVTGAAPLAILTSICFGAAMLHPSIVDVMRVRPGVAPLDARRRLAFITTAAVFAAIVALVGQLIGEAATVDAATDVLVLAIVALFGVRAWILATEAGKTETRLARTEVDLERTSALVAGISDAMPGALFAGDLATLTLDYVSPGLRTLIGGDPASVLGKPGWIVERIHPDDRAEYEALARAAHADGRTFQSFENRMRAADGGYRHVASTIRYLPGPDGKPERFVGVGIDVTERIAAQDELEASRELLDHLVATSPGMIFRGRMSPRVIDYISVGIEPLLGYRPDEVVGVEDWIPAHIHPDDAAAHLEALRRAAEQGGMETTRVVRMRAADGSYRALLTTFRFGPGVDRAPEFFASAIDVTEREELETRLRERDAFIADIARTSAAVIFAGRADTDTIEFVSPSVERVLGYMPEELVGVPGLFESLVHPDDSMLRVAQRDGLAAPGPGDVGAVRRIRAKDGGYRSLVFATRVLLDASGVARYVSSAVDISDRILLEDDLVAARDLAEQLVATSPGIIIRGRIAPSVIDYVSPGIEALLGYPPDKVVGVVDWIGSHVHPGDAVAQGEMMAGLVARGGGETTRVIRLRASDGSHRALLVTVRLRLGADGAPEYFASAIDVTEQEEADARLRERDAFISDVMRTSPAVIFAGRTDTDTIEFVSPSVEHVLGYAPDEVVGVPGFLAGLVHPDDAALWAAQHETAEAAGVSDVGSVRRVRGRDGIYRSLVFATHVSRDAEGISRFVSNAMDISDRIELEEDLVTARDAAEEASRAKTEFLSLVSHELRTPLNAILGFGELLERSELPDEDVESVGFIMEAGRNLLRLIDRILDYVRLESGRLRLDMGPIVPVDIVRHAIFRARPLAEERGVAIEDRTAPYADLVCRGDGRRLGPILDSLLDNAIRHGGSGVTVVVSLAPDEGCRGRIAVADDGVGMTEEQVADALAPLSRNGIGTGVALGLSLARRLVEAMGGTFLIESRLGGGTTVSVALPVFVEPASALGGSGPGASGNDGVGDVDAATVAAGAAARRGGRR